MVNHISHVNNNTNKLSNDNNSIVYLFIPQYSIRLPNIFKMKRVHTCPSNHSNTSFKYLATQTASIFKERLATQHTPPSLKMSSKLVLALKQNRLKHEKSKSKKKLMKGLLDSSMHKFRQERLSIPYFTNIKNVNFKEARNSIQSNALGQFPPRIKVDMDEVQQMKKEILQNLKKGPFWKPATPLISKREGEVKQNKKQSKPMIAQVQSTYNLNEVKLIKEYIQNKIDIIGQILDKISVLMSKHKIHFRITLFLFYKLYWINRVELTHSINLLQSQQDSQQLKNQNKSIEQCLTAMMLKLRQSKKWNQFQPKYIFQEMNFDYMGKRKLVKTFLQYVLKDYMKLMALMQYSEQNIKDMYDFSTSVIIITKKYIQNNRLEQAQCLNQIQKPQKKHLEQLSAFIVKMEKEYVQ